MQMSSIPQLEGDSNYNSWKESIESHLEAAGLVRYAKEKIEKPQKEEDIIVWTRNRANCFSAIWDTTMKVHERLEYNGYTSDKDPHNLWTAIEKTIGILYAGNALPAILKIGTLNRGSYNSTTAMLKDFSFLRKRIQPFIPLDDRLLASWLLLAIRTTHEHLYTKHSNAAPVLEAVLDDLNQLQTSELSDYALVFQQSHKTRSTIETNHQSKGRRNALSSQCMWCERRHRGDICYWIYPEALPMTWPRRGAFLKDIYDWQASDEGKRLIEKARNYEIYI